MISKLELDAWGMRLQCRILMKSIVWSAQEGVCNLLTNILLTCMWRSINGHDMTEPMLTFECEGLKSENNTGTLHSQIQMIEMWQQSISHPAFVPPPTSLPLSPFLSDIDECAEGKHYCRENTMCVNTPGSFMCICHTGYIRIDDYSCTGEFLCWPLFFFDGLEPSGAGADVTLALRSSASRATILCGGFAQ